MIHSGVVPPPRTFADPAARQILFRGQARSEAKACEPLTLSGTGKHRVTGKLWAVVVHETVQATHIRRPFRARALRELPPPEREGERERERGT